MKISEKWLKNHGIHQKFIDYIKKNELLGKSHKAYINQIRNDIGKSDYQKLSNFSSFLIEVMNERQLIIYVLHAAGLALSKIKGKDQEYQKLLKVIEAIRSYLVKPGQLTKEAIDDALNIAHNITLNTTGIIQSAACVIYSAAGVADYVSYKNISVARSITFLAIDYINEAAGMDIYRDAVWYATELLREPG